MGIGSVVALSVPAFLPLMTLFVMKRADNILPVQRDSWDRDYDYIVVGAGSAGAVMANRLSEDPTVRVLLLEAGGSENLISDIPIAYQSLQQTPMDWSYVTEPQEAACFGHKEKVRTKLSYCQGFRICGNVIVKAIDRCTRDR